MSRREDPFHDHDPELDGGFECEFGCAPMDHGIGIEGERDDPWVTGSIMTDPPDAGATAVYDKMNMPKFDMLLPKEYTDRIEAGEPEEEVQADFIDRIAKSMPSYDKMVSRNKEGPDPLVPEP